MQTGKQASMCAVWTFLLTSFHSLIIPMTPKRRKNTETAICTFQRAILSLKTLDDQHDSCWYRHAFRFFFPVNIELWCDRWRLLFLVGFMRNFNCYWLCLLMKWTWMYNKFWRGGGGWEFSRLQCCADKTQFPLRDLFSPIWTSPSTSMKLHLIPWFAFFWWHPLLRKNPGNLSVSYIPASYSVDVASVRYSSIEMRTWDLRMSSMSFSLTD